MRFRDWILAISLTCAVTGPVPAAAATFHLPVIGGPGLYQGAICVAPRSCPDQADVLLQAPAGVSGSFTYDSDTGTVDFSLTLMETADLVVVLGYAGTTFSAASVPVVETPLGDGSFEILQSEPATADLSLYANVLNFNPFDTSAALQGLSCVVGLAPGDFCSFTLSFRVPEVYDVFLGFSTQVPEPATSLLVAGGVTAMAAARRRRRGDAARSISGEPNS